MTSIFPYSERGVTLIELLIIVVILGVLGGLAAPNFGSFISARSVEAETRRVISALKLARSEARARGATVTLARTAAGWQGPITIYEDTTGPNGPFAAPDELVKMATETGRNVVVLDDQATSSSVPSDVWISFNMKGWLAETSAITIALCAPGLPDSEGMYIAVNRVGKIRERPIGTDSRGCTP